MPTAFFPLEPQGLGTHDIEALDSYLLRLATEHGVTEYQLTRLLAFWWNSTKEGGLPSLGEHVTYVAKVGYGRDIDTLLKALEKGTGFSALEGMTLTSFRDVSGLHTGSLARDVHYWCPACMREQVEQGLPVYEKLLWRLKPIARCSAHEIALERCCPACGEHQIRHVDTWPNCSECGACLVGNERLWRRAMNPTAGEKDITEIVDYCAKNPGTVFQKDAARNFWGLIRDMPPSVCRGADYFHSRPHPSKTLIDVLLRFASEVQVPLLSILLDPNQAAAIRPLLGEIKVAIRSSRKVKRLTASQRARLKSDLQRCLGPKAAYRPLTVICREHGCTTTVARYWFPDLTRAVLDRNLKIKRETCDCHTEALHQLAIDAQLLNRVQERGWHQVVRELSKECNTPVHLVREQIFSLRKEIK